MSEYKVPQDVEADDKLIGPFSFRQFVYLIIVAMAGAIAWGLAQLFVPLAIIPLPIIIFFGAIALPLRKDQPMEIFMAAMVSFYIRPRSRKWDPDGIESLIEITVPKTNDIDRTKDITQSEAQKRFSYLAEVVDSQGWSVRGTVSPTPSDSAVSADVLMDAQSAEDILADDTYAAQTLNKKLDQSDEQRRQEITQMMNDKTAAAAASVDYFEGPEPILVASTEDVDTSQIDFNPYPDEIQQANIMPIHHENQPVFTTPIISVPEPAPTTSEKVPSADIINLANNNDLSIATIAKQANRINGRPDMSEEVVISLR